ncbi:MULTISPECIES: hypothetical protein [Fusobacterium]|jgi:histidinol phosphatase-like enzyme|uniref:Lipoprotein n=1 Tax=Fusobacterium varium ATCC 27725 TaxID=469618 RepID=A0ABM6U6G6_FUSVA|nr:MULTISPECIES: hypothetical protein [Fusobacterium]AVQ31927.1 hypothetical protein C4N18_12115 [Fusobacterium varium ATCC 27725]EES63280.1 hypothetical protein FVAG_00969 [Fusobacterium varium ATCC 27725]MCF0169154.1 hypothetical protein [Fusobacterium varium]MCF2672507.1 hypothetical protein [Fusobacterium varium]MCI6034188.1 hypothetical protein [Fusobacterium varium]
MRKKLVAILGLVFFTLTYSCEYDEKVNDLLKNEIVTIEDREILISLKDWDKLSDIEKKELLGMMNRYTRKHTKKSAYMVIEKESRVKLAEIGVTDVVLYEYIPPKVEEQEKE